MKLSLNRIIPGAVLGILVFWILRHVMDPDIDSVHAAIQRGWLVVGLLFAGAYVVLRSRQEDREHYRQRNSPAAVAARYRHLGALAWAFTIVGTILALRLIWQMI